MPKKWYQSAYHRNVIDMHIADYDERFMSEFDPKTYVDMLVLSQVQSAVVYAHSHVGHCYYPTKVGHQHAGLKGRNILAEVIERCHQKGIDVVVYYSLIYDSWAYSQNPDWRIILAGGKEASEKSRYGVCCPNSPYRYYAVAHVEEICKNFNFEGIRFDMTFWPAVCYCRHCRRRFADEVGGDPPKRINWEDPLWVRFQRKREEWLIDFAALMTATVRKIKPDVSVEHQSSTYPASWVLGVTEKLASHSDFLQGDFYGDALQGSFARKLFYNLSENLPYGFETSVCMSLNDHTAKKPKELLEAQAFASLADGGAFVFIDAIDPVGTLNRTVYETMGYIFNQTKRYEPYMGGELCQDVGVYFSTESKWAFVDNGMDVAGYETKHSAAKPRLPHVDAAVSVCKSLIESHIPFGVVTKKNISALSRHQILVLPNVLMMDEEEADAIREYVRSGGSVYASGYTSLITKDGIRKGDFLLSDVFGVSYIGETKETYTYVAPSKTDNTFGGYSQKYPLGLNCSQLLVKAPPGVEVLAYTVLPYSDPADPSRYASIHSNPPGVITDNPAIVLNHFEKGKSIYVTADLESSDIHRGIFISLIHLLQKSFSFEVDAPKPVEVTMFHQKDKGRYCISLVNFQKELPNIPIDGIKIRVKLADKRPKRLVLLPSEEDLSYEAKGKYIEFMAPRLEDFLMFALYYAI